MSKNPHQMFYSETHKEWRIIKPKLTVTQAFQVMENGSFNPALRPEDRKRIVDAKLKVQLGRMQNFINKIENQIKDK